MTDTEHRPRLPLTGQPRPRPAPTGRSGGRPIPTRRRRTGMRRRPTWRRMLRKSTRIAIVLIIGIPIFAVSAGAAGVRLLLFGDLPGTVPKERPPLVAIPAKLYDTNGAPIGEFRQFDLSVPVTQDDIPQVLKDAVVAAEDHTFWTHKGIDFEGLSRAAVANYNEERVVQGGSTITQQYVRAKFLNNQQTFERKLNEVLLATRVERELIEKLGSEDAAKEEILFQYLSTTYFGGGAYGVGAAAQTYFRKPVKDLSASEAATLVAMIPAPSKYDPRINPKVADERRVEVLHQMRILTQEKAGQIDADNTDAFKTGLDAQRAVGDKFKGITQTEYEDGVGKHLYLAAFGAPDRPFTLFWPPEKSDPGVYPYFNDYVRQYLLEKYGPDKVYRGGLVIETTIDPHLQQLADQSVAQALNGTRPPLEMSLVSMEPSTGFVKALVGGRDFTASQVNLALGGITGMQPGSSFKPYTIARALEEGYGPDTVYNASGTWTVPGCSGACTVKGGAGGPIDMRAATAGSINTYFAQLINDVGPNKVAELAHRVGVSRIALNKSYGISLTLGAYEVSPLDMAQGYSVFANHGVKADATPVKKVTMADGTVLEDNTGARGTRVLSAPVADWTTDLMTGVIKKGGTGERADIGRPAAGKTGSAEHNKAAWFVGYTPQLVAAIWMGYSDAPKPLLNINGFGVVFGGTLPALTWNRYMKAAMEGQPAVPFPEPGVLPAPSSGIRKSNRQSFPNVVKDCGGPCVVMPSLTSPPSTAAPAPDGQTVPPSTDETTTTSEDPDAFPTTVTTAARRGQQPAPKQVPR